MPPRQTALPNLWLISDARNDAVLETILKRLPHGSGLIFRHYHLLPAERRARFAALRRVAQAMGHTVILAGPPRVARAWRADGSYGPPLSPPGRGLGRGGAPRTALRLTTAHTAREIAQARQADAILLSPIFPTRSHPGAKTLGSVRGRLLARLSRVPVIALGGMTPHRARTTGIARWAAIDGIASPRQIAGIPRDS